MTTGLYAFFFAWIILFLLPINPLFPSSGLDPSWKYVVDYASSEHLRFGEDIYFTFGPLGSFWFPSYYYNSDTYVLAVFISLFIAIFIFIAFVLLLSKLDLYQKIITLSAVIVGLSVGNYFFWYLLPILFVGIYLKDNHNLYLKNLTIIMLIIFLAFSVLIKFSHFPTAFFSVLLIDFYYVNKKKKIPFNTLFFFLFMILIFSISGQEVIDFPAYIFGSFQTLSGYSESMQLAGPNGMIFLFLFMVSALALLIGKSIFEERKLENFIFAFVCFLVLFMSFKNGFVRHDGHAIQAFAGMAFVFGMLFLYFAKNFQNHSKTYTVISILTLLSLIFSIEIVGYYQNQHLFKVIDETRKSFKQKALLLPNILSQEHIDSLNKEYNASIERIKSEFVIKHMQGTVDIYPWDQAYILANKLDYSPRPLFQSYSVYTPNLIEKNRKFLYSDKAPENIFFAIKEIDGRAPYMMEGASWLDIIKLYDIVDIQDDFLILKKTKLQKSYTLTPLTKHNISFGESINVPDDEIIYAKIDIKKSLLGRVKDILYKSPILYVELIFENGSTQKDRIIPGIASNGFILSPNIRTVADFFSFSIMNMKNKKVKSIRFVNESRCCYENEIEVSFSKIETHEFKESHAASLKLKSLAFNQSIITRNNMIDNKLFNLENYKNEQIIFSHVGTKFKVLGNDLKKIASNKKIHFGYSIKDEAYAGENKSDGACFKVFEENNLIFENCIDPRSNSTDRRIKKIGINFDEKKKYFFEVTSRDGKSAAYGWSYWLFYTKEKNESK